MPSTGTESLSDQRAAHRPGVSSERWDGGAVRHELDTVSADKLGNERFLLGGLDSVSAHLTVVNEC